MNIKNLLLLAGFGLFAAQMHLLQAAELQIPEEKSTQNLFVDTAPVSIMKWSGAIAYTSLAVTSIIIAGAAIYYVPGMLKNMNEATKKINHQTVEAWTQAGISVENNTGSIVKIVDDFSTWLKLLLKDSLTFNIRPNESILEKLSEAALRDLPPHTGF